MTTPNPTNMEETTWEDSLTNLKCINGAMYFGAVERPCGGRDTGECCRYEQTFDEAITEIKDFIRKELQLATERGERKGRKEEKARILACGHAHEPVHGFQPYGLMDEEKERAIFEDGFRDGRAMLMIDVISKRNPTPHKGGE